MTEAGRRCDGEDRCVLVPIPTFFLTWCTGPSTYASELNRAVSYTMGHQRRHERHRMCERHCLEMMYQNVFCFRLALLPQSLFPVAAFNVPLSLCTHPTPMPSRGAHTHNYTYCVMHIPAPPFPCPTPCRELVTVNLTE